jgi:hypothetical protein
VIHLEKTAYLSVNDIICDYTFTIGMISAKNRCKILLNQTKQPVLIVEYVNNQYFLRENFKDCAALNTVHPNKLVRCLVIDDEIKNECLRLMRVLSKSFTERDVPWQLRYNLIRRITTEFMLSPTTISKRSGVSETEIKKYILEKGIPDVYKEIAINKGYGTLLNDIYRESILPEHLMWILFDMAVSNQGRLTKDKYLSLKRYLRRDYNLSDNPNDIRRQIIEITEPKDFIEFNYWHAISDKYSINSFENYSENEASLQ